MKKGFTLIELLMTLGIVSILLVILTQVFGSIISLRLKTDFTNGISQDSRYILAILEQDIVGADLITSPAINTTSSNLILQSQSATTSYSFLDNELLRTHGGDTLPLNISSIITSFSVSRPSDLGGIPAITVSFDLETSGTSDTPAQSRAYQATYSLRSQ